MEINKVGARWCPRYNRARTGVLVLGVVRHDHVPVVAVGPVALIGGGVVGHVGLLDQ